MEYTIQSGDDLGSILENLSPKQCIAVIGALDDKLSHIITSETAFCDAIIKLWPEQRLITFNTPESYLA